EGADAAVAVPQHTDGIKFLSINGSVTAFAEYGDIRVHKMLGYLPGFLHPHPQNGLVIGLGMGITVRSLLETGLEQVDCVELNQGVVQAARDHFAAENNSALADPRLSIILDDGRSFLSMTEKKYDIITSNAVHARLSGNLYTQEFYELCRDHLTPDGILCQWTSTNWLTPTEFKSLITAFQQVFPHTSLWLVNAGHLLMIGTPTPLSIPAPLFAAHFNNAAIRDDLHRYGMGTPEMFLAHYVIDERKLPLFLKGAPVNSDNHPIAELSRVIDKMQIPEILLSLIQLKGDLSSHLSFADAQTPSERSEFTSSVVSYAKAEKYYLESTFAHNIYGEPLLALNMLTLALQEQPDDYRYHEEAAGLNLFLAQQPDVNPGEQDIYLDNTINHLEAMTSKVPDFSYDWNNLGYVYMNRQRLQEAETAFKRALSLSPENALPLNYLASVMGAKGEWAEAERLLKQAIKAYPEEIESAYRLALVYERLQRRGDAKALYQQIEETQPNYRDVGKRLQNL
ncbi:MAG: tetratricopeptide repeat protein, partial [Calditrichaeota bacterium]